MVRVHLPEPNALDVRDLWDSITSAVGGAFGDDEKTTTTSAKATKTTAKTVLTTETPSGYTGELTTKTTAKAADKTTSTAKKTTTTEEKTTSTKTAAKTTATSTSTADKTTKKATSITATTAASSETLLTLDTAPTTSTSSTATSTSATAAANTTAAASGGSPAAKAGIAIGVLAGLFFVGLAVFLIFRRRQKQQQRLDDEKNGPFADSAAIPGSKPAGSRLSMRPVTQLFTVGTAVAVGAAGAAGAGAAGAARGNNAAAAYPNRRTSRGGANGNGNSIALQNQAPMGNRGPYSNMNRVPGGAAAWGERPMTSQSQNQANPFGDGAQRLGPNSNNNMNNAVSPVSPSNSANGFSNNNGPNNMNKGAMAAGAAAGAAAGVYAANNLTRKTSIRKDGPQALDLTLAAPRGVNGNGGLGPVPPSPSGTDYSLNSMAPGQSTSPMAMGSGGAAIAAAGGPAVSAVHRVQLDFKPTLEDELGLRAGQLVRLLHEYDDGWALCIRLDRSQQGVVPRTCLSVRPVKPRPPPNGNARPGPPINTNGGPGGRGPMGPNGPNGPMNGRGPMGPGGPNGPMSQMNNMGRPQSPAGQQRPMTPQGGPGAPRMMMNSNMSSASMNANNMQARTQSPSPMFNELPAAPASASSSKAPSLPPMSFSELPAFNATPSDASRSPSPSSNRTMSPAPLATASTANVVFGTAISGPSGGPQSPIEMPVAEVAAAEMPAIGIATSVAAPSSDSSPTEYTPGSARVRPVNSIGRKPVPGQAL